VARTGGGGGDAHGPTMDPATRRAIDVYAAIIDRLATTSDSTFGDDPDFPAVFVVERPIPPEARQGIEAALPGVPIEWVESEDDVVDPMKGGVRGDGVVLTLGELPDGDERIEVDASLYAGPLAATWLTYVVVHGEDGWAVEGTTGPVAIS
jgi:hypothetical protein